MKPDFSGIKTVVAARHLVTEGKLEAVLLFPAELGGENIPQNTVYVTPSAAQAKAMIDGTIHRFAQQGLIDKLDVTPEYKRDSIVPSRIVMHATSSKKPGGLNPVIDVW
ncbi:hypothetical protein [Sphingomonas sp. UYP23]